MCKIVDIALMVLNTNLHIAVGAHLREKLTGCRSSSKGDDA